MLITTGSPVLAAANAASLLLRNIAKTSSAQPPLVFGSGSSTGDWTQQANCSSSDPSLCTTTTLPPDDYSFASQNLVLIILLAVFAGAVSIVTVLGNLLVLASFVLDRQIRQPGNYFIASLAVTDFLIGLFSMPLYTMYLLLGYKWPLGTWACDLWLSLDYTVCLTSQYTVFFITLDRFCSVTYPARYRAWRTEKKLKVMVLLTWILPALIFYVSIIGWPYFVGERTVPLNMCYVQFMENPLFNTVLVISYYWTTLVVIMVLYVGIYRVALEMARKSQAKRKNAENVIQQANFAGTGQQQSITGMSGVQNQGGEEQHAAREGGTSDTAAASPPAAHIAGDVEPPQTSSGGSISQLPQVQAHRQPVQRLFSTAVKQRSGPGNSPLTKNKNRQLSPRPSEDTISDDDHVSPKHNAPAEKDGESPSKPTKEGHKTAKAKTSPSKLKKNVKTTSETSLSNADSAGGERGQPTSSSHSGESSHSHGSGEQASSGMARGRHNWFRIKLVATVFRRMRPRTNEQMTPTIHVEQIPLVTSSPTPQGISPMLVPSSTPGPPKKPFDPSDFGGIYLGPPTDRYVAKQKQAQSEAQEIATKNDQLSPEPIAQEDREHLRTDVEEDMPETEVITNLPRDTASMRSVGSRASSTRITPRSMSLKLNNTEGGTLVLSNSNNDQLRSPDVENEVPVSRKRNSLQTSTRPTTPIRRLSPSPTTPKSLTESRPISVTTPVGDGFPRMATMTFDALSQQSAQSNRTITEPKPPVAPVASSSTDSLSVYGCTSLKNQDAKEEVGRGIYYNGDSTSLGIGTEIEKMLAFSPDDSPTSSSTQIPFTSSKSASSAMSSMSPTTSSSKQTSRSSSLANFEPDNNQPPLHAMPLLDLSPTSPETAQPIEAPDHFPVSIPAVMSVATQVSPTIIRAFEREKYQRAVRPPKLDIVIRAPPEALCGIRYADSESIFSLSSQDTVRILPEYMDEMSSHSGSTSASNRDSEPSSPVWIRRNTGHKLSTLHCVHELPEQGTLGWRSSAPTDYKALPPPQILQPEKMGSDVPAVPYAPIRPKKLISLLPAAGSGWNASHSRMQFYNRHFCNLAGFEQLQVSIIPANPDDDTLSQMSSIHTTSLSSINKQLSNGLTKPLTRTKSASSQTSIATTAAFTSTPPAEQNQEIRTIPIYNGDEGAASPVNHDYEETGQNLDENFILPEVIIANAKSEPNFDKLGTPLPLSQSAITAVSAPPFLSHQDAERTTSSEVPPVINTDSTEGGKEERLVKLASVESPSTSLLQASPTNPEAAPLTMEEPQEIKIEEEVLIVQSAEQNVEVQIEQPVVNDNELNNPSPIEARHLSLQTDASAVQSPNPNPRSSNVFVDMKQKLLAFGRRSTAIMMHGENNPMLNKDRRRSNRKSENRATKALRTITFILGAFVLTWTPYHIFAIIKGFCNECVDDGLYSLSYWLCYVASPLNPFCYAFANKQFKKAFLRILRCDLRSY